MRITFENYTPGTVLMCAKAVETAQMENLPEMMVHDGDFSMHVKKTDGGYSVRWKRSVDGFSVNDFC